jgi:hypothetical protein
MAVNFPANPQVGDYVFTGTEARQWNGVAWVSRGTYSGETRTEIDGGHANSVYTLAQRIDGGNASSVYTNSQKLNGGTAGNF